MFSVEFDLSLIFQWFEGILEGYFDDFSVIRMGKNGVKWAFCRTHYRTRKWGLDVKTSDMPFPAIEHLF